jgi:integral membrane protein
MKYSNLTIFRMIAFLEGVSYIALLFIGVPLKYIGDNEIIVKLLGMPHGILFVIYILLTLYNTKNMRWNKKDILIIMMGSIIPFGTFYVEKKYLR